jgi:tetratricopeptide (TPR) repeat protein
MTRVRALAGGVVWVLAALGCTARTGAAGPPTAVPGAVTVSEGAGPTEVLMALRAAIAQARTDAKLTPHCMKWADELTALHARHGEPYVGARLEAAALLHECGRPDQAQARLLEAIDAMPRWARAEARNTLGVLAHERGDDGAAIVQLQAALHADPALHEARSNLVRVLLRIYDGGGSSFARDDALQNLETWIALAPDDLRAQVQLARFHTIRARREPAAANDAMHAAELQLVLVLREDPPPTIKAEVLVAMGQLRLDRGDEAQALRMLKHALELDPSRGTAALLAATVQLRMRGFHEAHAALEAAATTVDPVEEQTRLRLLAVALRGLERYDDAAEVYGRLLAVAEPDPIDLYNRAQLERYRLDREGGFDAVRVQEVRARFDEVLAATQGDPAHAEIQRRARAERQALDELMSEPISVHRALNAEAAELERLEREAWPKERQRRLELEAEAKAAWEASQREEAGARK